VGFTEKMKKKEEAGSEAESDFLGIGWVKVCVATKSQEYRNGQLLF
jgi:hypothetical protein